MRICHAGICLGLVGLLSACTGQRGTKGTSPFVMSIAAQESAVQLIDKGTFTSTAKNIRPDLKRTDREIKQTLSLDLAAGRLVCTKALVYTPTNDDFSDQHYEESVLLKDLDPNRITIAGDEDNGWRIDAYAMGNKDVVTNKEGKKLEHTTIWCPDKNSAQQIKDALSLLVREARSNQGSR